MGIDHRRFDIIMAQELLDRPDIVTTFEQMSGKRMPERMASSSLGQSGLRDRISHGFLNQGFVNVMATLFLCLGIGPPALLRKYPSPICWGVGVFAVQGAWHLNSPPAVGHVALMDRLDLLEVVLKRDLELLGEHGDPLLRSLTASEVDFVAGEINILNAQAQTFHQPQGCAIH